jgi:hypothetical protein
LAFFDFRSSALISCGVFGVVEVFIGDAGFFGVLTFSKDLVAFAAL